MENISEISTTQEKERIKAARVTDNDTGKTYTLDFNLESIEFAENRGFKIESVRDTLATSIPDFFFYAFRMHHKRDLSRHQVDSIRERWGGVPDILLSRLFDLYQQALEESNIILTEEEAAKNPTFTIDL